MPKKEKNACLFKTDMCMQWTEVASFMLACYLLWLGLQDPNNSFSRIWHENYNIFRQAYYNVLVQHVYLCHRNWGKYLQAHCENWHECTHFLFLFLRITRKKFFTWQQIVSFDRFSCSNQFCSDCNQYCSQSSSILRY